MLENATSGIFTDNDNSHVCFRDALSPKNA